MNDNLKPGVLVAVEEDYNLGGVSDPVDTGVNVDANTVVVVIAGPFTTEMSQTDYLVLSHRGIGWAYAKDLFSR